MAVRGIINKLRAWLRSGKPQDNLTPHQRWPEILHWERGDEFKTDGWRYYSIRLKALSPEGFAYCYVNSDDLAKIRISDLVGKNQSLRNRQLSSEVRSSDEYMELLRQFNIAYAELEQRDKKLKLVS